MAVEALVGRERVLEAIQRIAPVIEGHRDESEEARRLPDVMVAAMREAGLFKLWTPREFGGDEVDLTTFMAAVEAVACLDGAAGWTFANLAAGDTLTAFLPEVAAKEIYTAGPSVALPGSVIPAGRAVPAPGGYRLSGRWPLASGCDHGDWLVGVALVFDGEAPRLGPDGAPDLKAMLVPREACRLLDTWHSVGLRGTGSNDFVVEDAFIPEGRTFSVFTAPSQVSGALYRAGILPLFSMAIASVLLGIARAAIDAFVDLARLKTPTLSQTGLAARPTIHAGVARAEALLGSARSYLYGAAGDIMASLERGAGLPDDLEVVRRLACVNAGESCTRAVDMMFALAGTTPIYSGHRLERCLRDVHTAAQHLLVSPVWWEKTGQFYFGHGLGMP